MSNIWTMSAQFLPNVPNFPNVCPMFLISAQRPICLPTVPYGFFYICNASQHHQKLGDILENKMILNLSLSKNIFYKKCGTKFIHDKNKTEACAKWATHIVKSKAVDRSTIQFWTILSKSHISIKIPLHIQSENPWLCH